MNVRRKRKKASPRLTQRNVSAGQFSPTSPVTVAKAGGQFYVRTPDTPTWLNVVDVSDPAKVSAWLFEGQLPPVGPSYSKTLQEWIDAVPATDILELDIVDRPGRSGKRFVSAADGDTHLEAGASEPELGFRACPAIFEQQGRFKVWTELAERVSSYPVLGALTGLALASVVQSYVPAEHNAAAWIQGGRGKTTALRWAASLIGHPHRMILPFSGAVSDLGLVMQRFAGATLLLDDAALSGTPRSTKAGQTVGDTLRQLSAGMVDGSVDARTEPYTLSYAVASNNHLADYLINLPHNQAAAVLDRVLVLSLDDLAVPPEVLQDLNAAVMAAFGRVHWQFARAVQERHENDADRFAAALQLREFEFKEAATSTLGACNDTRVVDMCARLHAVNAFAVARDLLPTAYADHGLLLKCLAAQRRRGNSLTPYEQLLELANSPGVIDLRTEDRPEMTDEELNDALFVRQVGNRVELLMTWEKLTASIAHPTLFLNDPVVRRAYRPDSDLHTTRQVRVRSNAGGDRLLCFALPWPAKAAA